MTLTKKQHDELLYLVLEGLRTRPDRSPTSRPG